VRGRSVDSGSTSDVCAELPNDRSQRAAAVWQHAERVSRNKLVSVATPPSRRMGKVVRREGAAVCCCWIHARDSRVPRPAGENGPAQGEDSSLPFPPCHGQPGCGRGNVMFNKVLCLRVGVAINSIVRSHLAAGSKVTSTMSLLRIGSFHCSLPSGPTRTSRTTSGLSVVRPCNFCSCCASSSLGEPISR